MYVCVCRKHFWLLIIITSHLNLIHNTIRVCPLEYALLMYVVSHSETESSSHTVTGWFYLFQFSSFRTLFVVLFLCRFSSKSSVIELSKDHHRRALSNKLPYAQTICPLYILTIYYRSSFHLPPTQALTRLFWNGIVSCEFLIHVLCNHTHTKGHYTVPMYIWMSWVSG